MFSLPSMRYLIEAITNREVWHVVSLQGVEFNVGWQTAKDAGNKRKHGLSLADGIPIISQANSESILQYEGGEEREAFTGLHSNGKPIGVVIETVDTGEDASAIRIISVFYR